MTGRQERAGYEGAVLGWARHVRSGGTTPWLEYCSAPPLDDSGDLPAGVTLAGLPAAAQLELVRRLAERAGRSRPSRATVPTTGFAALADRVLTRPAPGRGAADRPPAWPDDPAAADARRGAPSVDPAALGADELLRLGAGLVVDLLVSGPEPLEAGSRPLVTAAGARAGAWIRAWARDRGRPAYRVVGAPTGAARVRAALADAGHSGRGGRAEGRVFVIVDSVDALLADAWALRVRRGSRTRWRTFVGARAARGELPPAAALDQVAAFWAERAGPERVHLVATAAEAPATVAAVLGLPAPGTRPRPAQDGLRPGRHRLVTGPLSPPKADVVRRVNAVLRVTVPPADRPRLVDRLDAVLTELPAEGPALGPSASLRVPDRHRRWAAAAGRGLAHRLAEGGYPVHGDLRVLLEPGSGPPGPPAQVVLETMLDAVLVLGGVVPPGAPRTQGGRR